ncbi:hypothetical protein [Hyphomicrobium sp.]|uniref:hypothetical protein n=1 Tax=Hyphomicrobium sp. TaxID=82 RepID=UPI000FA38176|nr:hypothetical protein [Hyphomicrobium sp.]RUO98417.1 MAG: hypothetical protein EKK30_11400 [Hyphomicrobium sp.]
MNRDGAELGREAGSLRLYADVRDSGAPQKPPRDWKRAILIFGLGALSWVATYVGMLELIEANMGDLPIVHRVIVGFSVAMLMTMIIWLLDQLFRPHPFFTKLFYAGGYIFLSLISIGFGFGFYWKVLESRGEASRSAESAVSEVQNALHGAETRLEQLQATLTQLTQVSTDKAQLEQTKGTSCPNSKPGDGPRRKMREDDAQRFSFASDFVKGRIGAVKADMQGLNGDLTKIVSADASTFDPKTGTRNEFMRALGRKLDLTATGFNAFRTDPQLRQIRTDLADRAERTTFGDGKAGTVSCPDPQLQMALRGVVKAIDQLPELQKPEIATVEGPEATIEAFRRLTTTFYGLLAFKMPPSADELRELQKKAIQSVESPAEVRASGDGQASGLSKRDYVPLAVALFVDLCLFLVSMGQRPGGRLDGLVPKMKAAERGPVIEILSRFNDIHRDKQIRENFELFRHVVFDMNGDYYVAVPLDAPPRMNPAQRESLRVEAQLLSNLFASFEREKIFKRTLLPTTGSIQKRLARQGSKFAGSESFRVYKFTNGAWSDIILGAVMGAARRAERNEFGGRNIEDDAVTTTPGPQAPGPETPSTPRPPLQAGNDVDDREPTAPPRFEAPLRAVRPNMAIDPDHAARFGPYARTYRPEPELTPPQAPRVKRPAPKPDPEADVTVKAANTNIAELAAEAPAPEVRPATVVTLPRVTLQTEPLQAAPAHAHVVLQRETATFSVPVSEAVMPPSLKSAMRAFESRWPSEHESDSVELSAAPSTILADARERVIPQDDQLSDHDRAFIRRIAPPAAE